MGKGKNLLLAAAISFAALAGLASCTPEESASTLPPATFAPAEAYVEPDVFEPFSEEPLEAEEEKPETAKAEPEKEEAASAPKEDKPAAAKTSSASTGSKSAASKTTEQPKVIEYPMPEEPEDWLDASVSYIPEAPAAAYLPDPPADPPPASPPGASSTVYITDTGEKYHSGGCSYLKESKHAIGLDDALSQGYTACSRCDP